MKKNSRKLRTTIEDLRRRELIEAAHRIFMQHGLAGLTTQRICAEAGLSPGILTYYFKGKDEVLFAMVRLNNRILAKDVAARLRQTTTGWERLEAIVEGNFPQTLYTATVASAWLSLCAEAASVPRFARLQQIFYARLRSNIIVALGDAVSASRRAEFSLMIGAMIDGFWLRKATDSSLTNTTAITLILAAIARQMTDTDRQKMLTPTSGRKK